MNLQILPQICFNTISKTINKYIHNLKNSK